MQLFLTIYLSITVAAAGFFWWTIAYATNPHSAVSTRPDTRAALTTVETAVRALPGGIVTATVAVGLLWPAVLAACLLAGRR